MPKGEVLKNEIEYILDNLRDEDMQEVQALWKENWRKNIYNSLKSEEVIILYGRGCKKAKIPIAMGGFKELFEKNSNIACVWMLTGKEASLNKIKVLKTLKQAIKQADEKYDLMYNYIYKSNHTAKKWLSMLGFCFNNPKPAGLKIEKDFEFFYKLTNRKDRQCVY